LNKKLFVAITYKKRQASFLNKNSLLFKYGMMLLSVVLITIFLPKHPRFRFEFEKGKVWMHEDLISPYNFAILKTSDEITQDRADILRSISPIYDKKNDVLPNQLSRFNSEFETKWETANLEEEDSKVYNDFAKQLLQDVYNRGVIGLTKKFQINGENYNISLLSNQVATKKNTTDFFTQESALAYIEDAIEKRNSIEDKNWLRNLLADYIQPDILYNESLTNKLEEDALSNLSDTRGMVQRGELIVANGSTISNDIYQKLESLKKAYEEEERISGSRTIVVLGQFLLVSVIITLLIAFVYLFRKDIYNNNRMLSLILMIVTAMLILLSWAIKMNLPSVYMIPFCIVPIIFRILFDTRMALNIHMLVVLLAAFFVPNSFEFVFLQLSAGMVAIYSIKTLVKREQFLVSSALILITYIITYLGMTLLRNGSFSDVNWLTFVPFIISVLLTLLAYPLIYAFERVFKITSDVTMIELTNTNSKLLRELSYKAPGTFQHSLQVANLAEAAIYEIGGNALLIRAGALYHDIGKMSNPQYFIENQTKGYNPHDGLTFEQSAQIIISHVSKGLEMAKRAHLPEDIIDFIRTHHGTTRVDYFYNSYIKTFPEKFVDEDLFRYPGPIPFSKETAVLMLADSVEAASRSLKEPDAKSISGLVDKIVSNKLEHQQLKNSNITLKDIETIRRIFKSMLMSIYHVRVDYDIETAK
jgi:putative nucleotidyltransferase with HDIG domain